MTQCKKFLFNIYSNNTAVAQSIFGASLLPGCKSIRKCQYFIDMFSLSSVRQNNAFQLDYQSFSPILFLNILWAIFKDQNVTCTSAINILKVLSKALPCIKGHQEAGGKMELKAQVTLVKKKQTWYSCSFSTTHIFHEHLDTPP